MAARTREKRIIHNEGNVRSVPISIREIVSDPEFRAGYRAKLRGASLPRFHDSWGLERGRLVATWLLATGRTPPKPTDTRALAVAYFDADEAGAVI
jgi:hypothetical protein